jgi:hypothetical protein
MVTLITTNSHPYNLHLAPILSLPSGLSYRFRYRRHWVELGGEGLAQLKGKPCVIILRLRAGSYIPLRSCTVTQTHDYGDVFFFDLHMESLVDYTEGKITAYDQKILDEVYRGKDTDPVEKLVFDIKKLTKNDFKLDKESSVELSRNVWTHTVSELGKLAELKDVAFFRFALFGEKKESKPVLLDDYTYGYRVKSGTAYTFDVFEYVGGMDQTERIAKAFDFEMQTDPALLSPLKPKERVDGAYDRFELIFRTANILMRAQTFVILNNQQEIRDTHLPLVYIPVEVRNSLLKRIAAWVGIPLCIIFFLVPALAKDVTYFLYRQLGFDRLFGLPKISITDNVIQGLTVVIFIWIIANWDFSSFVTTLREKIKF